MSRVDYKGGVRPFPEAALRLIVAGSLALLSGISASRTASEPQPSGTSLPPGARIALARLQHVRAISAGLEAGAWKGFNPARAPAVLFQPGAWALAVGFPAPPPGFQLLTDVKDGERAVYQAMPGAFRHEGRSPGLVAGTWAVLVRFDAAPAAPAGDAMGRRSLEDAVAGFVGDALGLFLMEQRGAKAPYAVGPASYPDSAELTALTALENSLLLRCLQARGVTEKTFDRFHRSLSQMIAVTRARQRLLGAELAALERRVESWDGLMLNMRCTVLITSALADLEQGEGDASDGELWSARRGQVVRSLLLLHPFTRFPYAPVSTDLRLAGRGAGLAFLLNNFDPGWPARAIAGDRSLLDLLAEGLDARARALNLPVETEGDYLASAKAENDYDELLALAQSDLAEMVRKREEALAKALPGNARMIEIRLNGQKVTDYSDDATSVTYLGGGRILHRGGLLVAAEGLRLTVGTDPLQDGAAIVTDAVGARDAVKAIAIVVPRDVVVSVGRKPVGPSGQRGPITPERPLTISAAGLELRVSSGSLGQGGRADVLEIELPQPRVHSPVERTSPGGGI